MDAARPARALAGHTVIVTRARAQSAGLVRMLEEQGADVLALPVIALVDPEDWSPVDAALDGLCAYDWVVFTSANALDRFLGRARSRGMDMGRLVDEMAERKVAAVGPATAARCMEEGIRPDYVPEEAVAESLIDGFASLGLGRGTRVLLPRAQQAREVLPEALRAAGAIIDVVPVYRTMPADADPEVVAHIARGDADIVTFTSPSTVRNFLRMFESTDAAGTVRGLRSVSIGPVTSDALRAAGIEPFAEAPEHTSDGLVDALVRAVGALTPDGRPHDAS